MTVPSPPPLPESPLWAPLRRQISLFLRKPGGVSVCYLCSALGVLSCQEESLQSSGSCGMHEYGPQHGPLGLLWVEPLGP